MHMRIAALDDDAEQLALIETALSLSGYEVIPFAKGTELIHALARDSFDMILLDWEMPTINGLDVLRVIRTDLQMATPVMFITNRTSETDVILGLNEGADDYLAKPIRTGELLARVAALLRRIHGTQIGDTPLQFKHYLLDPVSRSIQVNGDTVTLKPREFELALFLFRHAGELLSRAHILHNIWTQTEQANSRTLDTHISRIRRLLNLTATNGVRLSTIYSFGYRLDILDTV